MLDIKKIRANENNIIEKINQRGIEKSKIDELLNLDKQRVELIQKTEDLRQEINANNIKIKELIMQKQDAKEIIAKNKENNKNVKVFEKKLEEVKEKYQSIMDIIPNVAAQGVPLGKDENDNVEIKKWGEPRKFDFEPKAHYEIGEKLGILDFERAAKVSRSRFLYSKNLAARLERAVYNFMLDLHVEKHGYQEVLCPYLVNENSMYVTGQYPKFKEDVFSVKEKDMVMISTAEIPLTNYYKGEILNEEDLPIYFTGLTPCFRSEAGSAGKDTRGMIRMHQFNKVEMVKFSKPEDSFDELEKLTRNAEEVLELLELPYRRIVLCTGDMGFTASKTYDIEVWFPQQNKYREISSCSNCLDFQARRGMIRYRTKDGEVKFLHTLNGSGLAVGRCVAAILENYQNEDGTIEIPKALKPYMESRLQ